MIACLEEIALKKQWIGIEEVKKQAEKLNNSAYGRYLSALIQNL